MDMAQTPFVHCVKRIAALESAVGRLALQVEQFMRTGLADADNQFTCEEFDEEKEARAFSSVYGPLMK